MIWFALSFDKRQGKLCSMLTDPTCKVIGQCWSERTRPSAWSQHASRLPGRKQALLEVQRACDEEQQLLIRRKIPGEFSTKRYREVLTCKVAHTAQYRTGSIQTTLPAPKSTAGPPRIAPFLTRSYAVLHPGQAFSKHEF